MDLLKQFGIDAPTGDLRRDLEARKRVLLRGCVPTMQVRAIGGADSRTIKFVCSTDGVKRDGNRVRNEPGSWDFTNFRKNPVMLWAHDYGNPNRPPMPPIGNWDEYGIEQHDGRSALVMTGRFATWDFADLIFRLYLPRSAGGDECLHSVSIGWTPLEWQEMRAEDGSFVGWDFLRNELLECSPVPIPADPDAIKIAAQRGLIPPAKLDLFVNRVLGRGPAYVLDLRDREPAESRDVATEPVDTQPAEPARDEAPAQVPGAQTAAAPMGGQSRSDLTDAVDPAYDRLRAAHSIMWEPIDALWYGISALVAEEQGEQHWMLDPKDAVARNLARIRAAASDVIMHCDAVAAACGLGAEPAPEGEVVIAGTGAPWERKCMKLSGKRLEKLYQCRDYHAHGFRLLNEIIQEGEDERTPKDEEAEEVEKEIEEAEAEAAEDEAKDDADDAGTEEKDDDEDEETREFAELAARLERALHEREFLKLGRRLRAAIAKRGGTAYADALLSSQISA